MRKLLSLTAGLIMLLSISLRGSAANPAEPHAPSQDGTMPALTAIAGQGMMSSEAYDDLEELSDYIGGRVTGSPQAGQAVQWGLQKMRAMGLEMSARKNGRYRGAGHAVPPAPKS
jgi:carboxypeptidase Q